MKTITGIAYFSYSKVPNLSYKLLRFFIISKNDAYFSFNLFLYLAIKPITSFDIHEDTNIVVSSYKKTTDILKEKGITKEKQLESDEDSK